MVKITTMEKETWESLDTKMVLFYMTFGHVSKTLESSYTIISTRIKYNKGMEGRLAKVADHKTNTTDMCASALSIIYSAMRICET